MLMVKYPVFFRYAHFFHLICSKTSYSTFYRDWETFVKPIRVREGDPVMTKWKSASFWKLENYAKDNKSDFIVPVSYFDFTDFDSNKSKSIV